MATPLKDAAWLEWVATLMGEAPRQAHAAALPPDRFHCVLDELPPHLIPKEAARSLRSLSDPVNRPDAEPLFLNPELFVTKAEALPGELHAYADLFSRFALQGTIAWIRDPVTRRILPFGLGAKMEEKLEELVQNSRPGQSASQLPARPSSTRALSRPELALLCGASILVPQNYSTNALRRWDEIVARSAPEFQSKGYTPLAGLIHPFHVAALRRYYRYLIRHGEIGLGDGQSPRRYVAYNEPVARFFHRQIEPIVSAIAGEPVKPSYVYLASYLGGAELKKHTDREQCEFSVTLCLDFSPEPNHATPWPVRLQTPNGTATVYQALGDGLVYRGTRVPHYRDRLAEGCTSTSIFFHYVPENFTGSLD